MYSDLGGKIAVITGSSKGIGAAIAKRFAAEGMYVMVNYHDDRELAEQVVREISEVGGTAVAQHGDVSKEEDVDALREAALQKFGGLDVWVNNAGMENQTSTHDMPLEVWQKVIDVNLTGVFLGSRAALRHFLGRAVKGSIINLSSVHELIPWPTFAHYTASKGGVALFTKTIALEYAANGIRVNAICPGAIRTPINAKKFEDPKQLETTIGMIPMRRLGEPGDVSAAAAWLASEESSYVTGISLFVDGGMVLYPSFQEGDG